MTTDTLQAAPETVRPETVRRKGYLPPSTRVDPERFSIHLNRFPLGDVDNYSPSRAAYAQSLQMREGGTRGWAVYAPWEKAYHAAVEEISYKAQGEMTSGADGGFLAPEVWGGPYFSLLRGFSVLGQLPVTTISVPARMRHLPKVTGDVTMVYPNENAALTNTQFLFGQMTYTARKATHLVPTSNELIRDAAEVADQILRQESARAHALDRDTQALIGQGGPNPTGLITLATEGTVSKYYPGASATASITGTAGHGTPSFLHVSQLRGKVHQLNGLTGTTAYSGQAHCNGIVAHSRFEQTVLTQAAAAGAWTDANGRPLWMGGLGRPAMAGENDQMADPSNLMGTYFALSNILPATSTDGGGTTSSFMIAGWWDMFVLFESNAFEYEAASEPGWSTDQTYIRAIHRYDCSPARPEAFAVLAGCDA